MRPIQRLISAGFATAALASASVPAFAWTAWPDVDFEGFAGVGRPIPARAGEPRCAEHRAVASRATGVNRR